MKECPFCKANIEENARFCLYCMKPLNAKDVILPQRKKRPWWPLAAIGVVLLLLISIVLICEEASSRPDTGSSLDAHASIGETKEVLTAVVYRYRDAQAGDEFNANYTNSGTDIVITGIEVQSEDGVYNIPAYIDGKKVIAIVANAFSGSNATVIYLPDTVKSIWNYAFADCPVADIYFTHNVYIDAQAFSGSKESLTIHCPADCHNRAFSYYSSNANEVFSYEEWNG